MADETLGVVLVMLERNRSRMIAAFKSQIKGFVSHLALLSLAASGTFRLFLFAVEFGLAFRAGLQQQLPAILDNRLGAFHLSKVGHGPS